MTLPSRGAVPLEELATAAGLDPAAVRRLVEAGEVDGLMDAEGRAVLVFDDTLPSADRLRALGLEPAGTYRPDELRSFTAPSDEDEDEEGDEDGGSTWTMAWGPEVGLPEHWSGERERTPADVLRDEDGHIVGVRTAVHHRGAGDSDDDTGLLVVTVQALGPAQAVQLDHRLLADALVALVSLTRSSPAAVHDLLPAMGSMDDPRWARTGAPPDLGGQAWWAAPLDVDAGMLVVRPAEDVLVTAVGDPRLLSLGLVWTQRA